MSKIDLLQVSVLPPFLAERLAKEYTIHDFVNAAEPEKLLDEVGPKIRGILAGGMKGPNANLINRLENLEIIASFSVGFDATDVVAAQRRGVIVTHTPEVLTGDKSLDDIRQVIQRVESDGELEHQERLHAIVATSVVSHGVDLERLNQMVLVGLPRSAAEYIQASSRAGRTHSGIVFTVFRWQNRRNVSMYEHFQETHERLYQLVQPVPINRVSTLSVERTANGILAALVYNLLCCHGHYGRV